MHAMPAAVSGCSGHVHCLSRLLPACQLPTITNSPPPPPPPLPPQVPAALLLPAGAAGGGVAGGRGAVGGQKLQAHLGRQAQRAGLRRGRVASRAPHHAPPPAPHTGACTSTTGMHAARRCWHSTAIRCLRSTAVLIRDGNGPTKLFNKEIGCNLLTYLQIYQAILRKIK